MNHKKKEIILSILGIVSLILITVGVSYAFFNYAKEGTKENSIETGTITFLYTEVSKVGKGISIQDAYPISDEIGKVQIGEGKVFDFKVTSTTPNSSSISYEVTARKKSNSTLEEDVVKVYLTRLNGELEEEVLLEKYSNLKQTEKVDSGKYIEKTIYQGRVPKDNSNYEENFRLRMWIDEETDFSPIKGESGEDIYPYNGKEFTITVNVYANGRVVTEEDKILEESVPVVHFIDYPVLTGYGVSFGVTIDYHEASTQRLYRINNGKWQTYQNKLIELTVSDILEAKSIFKSGIESNITKYQMEELNLADDALALELYDGNVNNSVQVNPGAHIRFIYVDQSAYGSILEFRHSGPYVRFYFYNENDKNITCQYHSQCNTADGGFMDVQSLITKVSIPDGTKYIKIMNPYSSSQTWYELIINNTL